MILIHKIYVWDVPTRAFHWCLVLTIGFQYTTATFFDDATQLHFYGGYFALGLIVFRIMWGFIGHSYAKFSSFFYSPKTSFAYATGADKSIYLSHNPLGALSVFAFLILIAAQAISGLFITDDIFYDGPYHQLVSADFAKTANWIHANLFTLLWVLIAMHLIAVSIYQYKGHKLLQAMISGYKESKQAIDHKTKTAWLKFLITALFVFLLVYLVVERIPPAPDPYDYY